MSWHVHPELLAEYDRGGLDPTQVMGVEAHLTTCAACRAGLRPDEGWVAGHWAWVLAAVAAPPATGVERVLVRLGLPEHRYRLIAATPSLRRSWLAATVAVLVFAVAMAYTVDGTDLRRLRLFLAVAPVLPVLAVAAAYGSRVDPMHEVATTTPVGGPYLLLWRSTAVLFGSIVLGGVAALLLPAHGWLSVAWLLPALCLSAASLALGTVLPLRPAAATLGVGWATAALAAPGFFGAPAQAAYLCVAAAAVAVVIVRHRRLDPGEPR